MIPIMASVSPDLTASINADSTLFSPNDTNESVRLGGGITWPAERILVSYHQGLCRLSVRIGSAIAGTFVSARVHPTGSKPVNSKEKTDIFDPPEYNDQRVPRRCELVEDIPELLVIVLYGLLEDNVHSNERRYNREEILFMVMIELASVSMSVPKGSMIEVFSLALVICAGSAD